MADKSNYEYYKTKNGYVDLSAYDELEQVEFFIDHPDAMEVTDVELRSEGIVRPSSAEFLEREELEGLANDEEIEKFKFIKFGTYSHKEGYRSGGKGDKVSREDFQTDEEWARYQNWNGDVKEPKLTLDEQINEAVKAQDLDVDPSVSHKYYNTNGNVDFVSKHYNRVELEAAGVNMENFQGWLENTGQLEEMNMYEEEDSFSVGYWTTFTPTKHNKDLAIAKERILNTYLQGYLDDQNDKHTQRAFLEEYNLDPDQYKDFDSYEDAYDTFRAKLQRDIGQNTITAFDYNALYNYADTHFSNSIARDKENQKKFEEYYEMKEEQGDFAGAAGGALDFLTGIPMGILDGADELSTTLSDWTGFDGTANAMRMLNRELDRSDPKKAMQYMVVNGKGGDYNGANYIVDKNGTIYNKDENLNVTSVLSEQERTDIYEASKEWENDYDFSARGSSNMTGNVIGNVLFQVAGTKGLGASRVALSSRSISTYNKLRKMKGLTPLSTRARNLKTGKFTSTKGTFGVNVPFDSRIIDATAFQSFYGATSGYEKTINAALEAGIPYEEAVKLAKNASAQTAVLYGITGPINPRLSYLNKMDDWLVGSGTLNSVISSYKKTGLKGANDVMKSRFASLMPTKRGARQFATNFRDEGIREVIQENIQQAGEFLIVNPSINKQAGQNFLKDNYTARDMVETSILSMAAGGLVGGYGSLNMAGVNSGKAQLQDMWTLSKDLKQTESRLQIAVNTNKITADESKDLLNSIKSVGQAKLPAWMINTPQEFIEAAKVQNKLEQLKRSKDKSKADQIAVLEQNLLDIQTTASTKEIKKEIGFVNKIVGKNKVKTFKSIEEVVKAGFSEDAFTDGWLEQDGVIYINEKAAIANQAVSVASHELLHKIIKSEFKNNSEIGKVVNEFKQILKDKGVWKVIQKREALYKADGRADLDGKDADEYLTMFSDALSKNEIPFESLQESEWMRIGRSILGAIKSKFGNKSPNEFSSGQQVFDFILDYHKNIKQGRITNQAQRMLDKFEPDEDGDRKRSINLEKKENQDLLDGLPNTPFIGSQQHAAAKALVDNGAFDKLIGAKLASGSNIFGRPREEVMEDIRDELKKHIERFNPENDSLFAYINSYIGRKVGTVTNRAKKRVQTRSLNVRVAGQNITQDIEDGGLNPEEIMIAKEAIEAGLKEGTKLKMGKQISPETIEKITGLIVPLIRNIDVSLLADKSINAKNSPMMSYLKEALGNSLVYDAVIAELGTLKSGIKEKLLFLKDDVLENATTTWLMGKDMGDKVNGGIPQAIDKVVDGKRLSYPDWLGLKPDREKMGTDNAGRTAGHALVFRNPNVKDIDNDVYLSQFIDEKGKLIRGRKEALAKHIAQEVGIEIFIDQIANNKDGAIAQEFNKNQLAKGVLEASDKIGDVLVQADREGVKRSLSVSKEVAVAKFERLALLGFEGNFKSLEIEKEYLRGTPYEFVVNIYEDSFALDAEAVTGYIDPLKVYAESLPNNDPIKKHMQEFLGMNGDQKLEAIYEFSNELAKVLPPEIFKIPNLGYDFLGVFDRAIKPNSEKGMQIKTSADSQTSTVAPAWIEDVRPVFSTGGIVAKISNRIKFKQFANDQEAQEEFDRLFLEEITKANPANIKLFELIVQNATSVVAKNPKLMPGYLSLFQSNTGSIIKGMRAFGILQDVEIYAQNQGAYVSVDGTKGYKSITGVNKAKYDKGDIVINYNHPLFTLVKEYVDSREADLIKELESTTGIKAREKIQKRLDKDKEILYKELLRPYTEHKNPASNKFGDIVMDQAVILSKLLKNPGLNANDIDVAIQAYVMGDSKLRGILSDFTMTINGAVVSKIQDDKHSKTSSLGDARVFAIDNKYIKKFYPVKGQEQALDRGLNTIKADVNKFIEIAVQQGALDVSRKRSLSLDPKGISVYDFDDTLAFSKSMVIVTMPNGRIKKITPAQFAAQDESLKAKGAKFDFSEFNKVVKGVKGPLIPRLEKAIQKFGNENIFVLTARPKASANSIYKFLKELGLEIPLKNIVGLENGTPAAKAGWMVNKVAEGYNDFYFVDDAYKNVKAVQDVLNVFDVKGKVQQAVINRKRSLSVDINKMIERSTGVGAEKNYSKVQARKQGAGKGKYKFMTYSAEDFRGLTQYVIAGKGKQGDMDQKWFEDNLVNPYTRGIAAMETMRQAMKNDYDRLLKGNPDIKKQLNKEVEGLGFTLDQVLRIYLYNKSGFDVPGISKRDLKGAVDFVTKNKSLSDFADNMLLMTKQSKWVEPAEFWDIGSILKDLNTFNDKISRKQYLAEFIENADIVFDEKTMNKLEALYGTKYREALENMLTRMKSGSNRPGQVKGQEAKWLNWLNNSVGTIMFFNRRSALLQMLSFTNFVNWGDNNPLMAAAAFANQPLYWKTWSEIFNSDKLKQRRGGLKSDVQEQEIANAAKNSKDKAGAIVAYLLKIGFTPTQIADSMAIATGGASFIINRTKTYKKQGMSEADAKKQAYEDFGKISDETQQSGDPMLISQQQSSHLGRLILAFQNTPMQYTRLMKKAAQDIANGRGDLKTNLSKIMYYGFIQNLIFNALQTALFAMLPGFNPEDDDEKYQKDMDGKIARIANNMIDSVLKGTGIQGAVLSTIKNSIMQYYKQDAKGYNADHTYTLIELANVSPPLGSKFRKVYSAIQTYKFNRDLVNERGFELTAEGKLNIAPAYEMLGSVVSAGFNLPLDRVVVELNSIAEVLDNRNTAMQRIALLMGFRSWDVNADNEENDFVEAFYKEMKKIQNKKPKKPRKPRKPRKPTKPTR